MQMVFHEEPAASTSQMPGPSLFVTVFPSKSRRPPGYFPSAGFKAHFDARVVVVNLVAFHQPTDTPPSKSFRPCLEPGLLYPVLFPTFIPIDAFDWISSL